MQRSLLFSVLLTCVFVLPVMSQTTSNLTEQDWQERWIYSVHDLAGPLKSVKREWAPFSTKPNEQGEYIEQERRHVKTLFFDPAGKIIKTDPPAFYCGTTGSFDRKRVELYDADGRKNGAVEVTYDVDGKLKEKTVYEYDSMGHTLSWAVYDDAGSFKYKWAFKYDQQGLEIEKVHYGQYGLMTSKEVYVRNEKGLIVEFIEYSSTDPLPVSKIVSSYEYDDYGNWVKSIDSKLVTDGGASLLKPVRVDYRTITYYTQNTEKQFP